MMAWLSKWTCPGWMYVPRKPHPTGNKFHTICCGLTNIMLGIEIVEEKDEPKEKPEEPTKFHGIL